ncbi:potassium-transporting ATPase KdpC subunit [Ktedonobacteria bacterium brp13]|nr:potassium-transporting ATPase KdpC subunit [Ktedonobacteria bacterium brp13]
MADLPEQAEPAEPHETASHSRRLGMYRALHEIGQTFWNACKMLLVLLLICGALFPLIVYIIGQTAFPFQANGSLLLNQQHQVVGSRLIGQSFTRLEYFHGRPGVTGYDASSSSGSNIGPTNPQLITGSGSMVTLQPGTPVPANATPVPGHPHIYLVPATYAGIKTYAAQFRKENGLAPTTPLPADIVTASGSGLDPDISVEAALLQVKRIVQARHALGGKNTGITAANLRALIKKHTSGRDLGILGEPRVKVLELNLDLDTLYGGPPARP